MPITGHKSEAGLKNYLRNHNGPGKIDSDIWLIKSFDIIVIYIYKQLIYWGSTYFRLPRPILFRRRRLYRINSNRHAALGTCKA